MPSISSAAGERDSFSRVTAQTRRTGFLPLTARSSIRDRDNADIDLHHLTMRRIRFCFSHEMNVSNLHLLIDGFAHVVDG